MTNRDEGAAERLRSKLASTTEGECWLWSASRRADGYGQFRFRNSVWMAHRAAYTLFVGEIPDGMEIDHLCQSRLCCNPDHLEPVTGEENNRRYRESLASGDRLAGLIADVALIIASTGRRGIHTTDLLAALSAASPDVYGGWDAERFSAELAAAGVRRTGRQVKIGGVNRAGYRLADILAADG